MNSNGSQVSCVTRRPRPPRSLRIVHPKQLESILRNLATTAAVILCAGCSVSAHVGYGGTQMEASYVAAIAKPMNSLTSSASYANQTCAGGSSPDPSACYSNTKIEIADARKLEETLHSIPTPARFAKANRDLLHGLDVFIQGLLKRNEGLADHSTALYLAGDNLIRKGLRLQRSAIAEFPPDAHITT